MTLSQAIKILSKHQKWRRGDDRIKQTNPTQLGIAIDVILEALQAIDMNKQ